ncbi:alanine racemase [Rhodoferax sp.]|uniref:alanine racemase n=1 Tax=Rhodoferax sp. TaxID=50421 RepID=UPI002ACEEB5D|nr:alanine racemase [Rhodoferax sp.]MDZ7811858.1 alanine racemase [Ideonella sp.]MDZ7920282.1 alanine racemase [Rhodoferax sp.]
MQRRHLILGASATGVAAAVALRPGDRGGAHDAYFQTLAHALQDHPAQPTLVVDKTRLKANLNRIRTLAHPKLPLRVVVKSLPSLPLLDEALVAWQTERAMLFNAQQLVLIAKARPQLDLLLGKPLRASAARWALEQAGNSPAALRTQWLVDSPALLADYRTLAQGLGRPLRINLEIDVGLHRGGVETAEQMTEMLALLREEPLLEFSGLMGYDAHLAAIPDLPGNRSQALAHAQARYADMLALARQALGSASAAPWTLNAAGSPTFHLHHDQHAPNELSVGSAAVKPLDFDKPSLTSLEPAAFIATPVLKTMETFRLPRGAETVSALARWWDVNQRQALAIHGGHWLADPVSPPGVQASSLYGPSSNQQVMVAPPSVGLRAGDWVFFRPRQSEAVFLQFGPLAVFDQGRLDAQWPVFPASA